jgi:hypothetical protein
MTQTGGSTRTFLAEEDIALNIIGETSIMQMAQDLDEQENEAPKGKFLCQHVGIA